VIWKDNFKTEYGDGTVITGGQMVAGHGFAMVNPIHV